MPYVNVRLLKGVTREQKRELVREITSLLQRLLNKKPESTHIVIDEVDTENWGVGGVLSVDKIEQQKKSS
jgi:4-oxalocrotonate tautomerase